MFHEIGSNKNGRSVNVTDTNRLKTEAVSSSAISEISKESGEAFIFSSDFISLTTTGSFNGIVYLKNNSTKDLYINSIRTCADGTGAVQVKVIEDPTTGTLISDANSGNVRSMSLGSNVTFEGSFYSASADGKTVTDGTDLTQFINKMAGHSIQEYNGGLILKKSKAFAITAKPSASTDFCLEIQGWLE